MAEHLDWEDEEDDLFPEDWTEEDIERWNKFLPLLKTALFESTMNEIRELEALPDVEIEFSDDFKIKMNKLFRDNFGEDCKIPHPEVEKTGETVNFLMKGIYYGKRKDYRCYRCRIDSRQYEGMLRKRRACK